MAKLSMAARKSLPKKDFGKPSAAPGSGSYPMPDRKHAILAKAFAAMHHDPDEAAIDAKANRKLGLGGIRSK